MIRTGIRVLAADDTRAEIVHTIHGDSPATFVHEVPNGSVIVDGGDTLTIVNNNTRILTIINANSNERYIPTSSVVCKGTPYNSQWIEGAEGLIGSSPDGYTFQADWHVPQQPSFDVPVTIWNGIFYCSGDVNTALIQPVLQWETENDKPVVTNPPQWYLQTWYVWSNSTTGTANPDQIFATAIGSQISKNDLIYGNIQVRGNVVTGFADDTNTGMISELSLTKPEYDPEWMNQPAYAQIVLEGKNPLAQSNSNFLPGPVTVSNFILEDSDGNNLLSITPMSSFVNPIWQNSKNFTDYKNLSVINRWPTDITLMNNPNRVNPPVANFNLPTTNYAEPANIEFTDASSGSPFLWLWNFGDGTTSISQNPYFHDYTNSGTYTINLTVWNAGGANSIPKTIYIWEILNPSIISNTNSGTAPLTVQFNGTLNTDSSMSTLAVKSNGILNANSGTGSLAINPEGTSSDSSTTWNWSFGDGTYSTSQNVSHTYSHVGTYTVTLTAGNPGGTYSSTPQTITVIPPITVASFTANPTSGTTPLTVQFTDTSTNTPTSWLWNFGDGTTSTQESPVHTFTSAGSYSVNLTATNAGGNSTSASQTITVVRAKLAASFVGSPMSGVTPLPVQFTDTSTGQPTGWAWYFGDGNWQTVGSNWTEMTASPGWNDSYYSAATALPDGSIVMLGGFDNVLDETLNDTWHSTDEGATWTLVNPSSGWLPRYAFPTVTLPDGSIVIMGGDVNYTAGTFLNDTWRSTNEGATWTEMNASSGWAPRQYAAAVALPDGNITILGGSSSSVYFGDVWQSTDKGATWTKINASAFGGTGLSAPAAVALQDGNIVVMGGYSANHGRTNRTYRSTDEGKTWTVVNGSGGWQVRDRFPAVPLPDGSIVFASGYPAAAALNDVWRSTNEGVTWKEMTAAAPWEARYGDDMVSLPDGSVVILSGQKDTNEGFANVWRMPTASSNLENPSHTFTTPGNYNVVLSVTNGLATNTSAPQTVAVLP